MDGRHARKWADFSLIPRSQGGWIATVERPALGAEGDTQDEACERLEGLVAMVRRLAAGPSASLSRNPSILAQKG